MNVACRGEVEGEGRGERGKGTLKKRGEIRGHGGGPEGGRDVRIVEEGG